MERRWRIELLGGLRVVGAGTGEAAGGPVITRFRTQKTGALLAYLAYYLQRAHPRDHLIELLWPEAGPDAASNSLSQALSSLRRQLEPPGVTPGAVLAADRVSVRLNPESVTTDTAAFEAAHHAAAAAESHTERVRWLAQAVELYRGELLASSYENWVQEQREWLAESFFQALSQLLALLEQAGDFPRALEYARRGVLADPLREEGRRDLMRLYAAVGQPDAALRQYRELERLLQQELEAAPATATRALCEEIQRLSFSRPSIPIAPVGLAPAHEVTTPPSQAPGPALPEGANRVVTVLVADTHCPTAAPTALLPEDESDLVHSVLQEMSKILDTYEGRVERLLTGGVVAVFGAPRAHEDDPERAIRVALEIREAAQTLGLSVTAGIDTGSAFVGGTAAEAPAAQDRSPGVVGPVVHLAAALQAQAATGQILVGEAAHRVTRRAFTFSPLTLAIPGMAGPVVAYAVAGALPRPQKAYGIEGLRAELIGRDEELAKLQAALAKVLAGEGQMVTLVGEAGMGKSRLVAELKESAGGLTSPPSPLPEARRGRGSSAAETSVSPPRFGEGQGERLPPLWLEGRALELGMSAGYWLFVDLFRDFFTWRPEEDDRTRGGRLAESLRKLAARGDLSEEQVEEMGPLLGNLLSLRFNNEWDERLKFASPEQIRHQTFLAVHDFFVALSRQRPVVLVLEDLHWADSLSLDLISLLMEALPQAPLLLLCVYRPEREHRCRHLATIAARKCPERLTEMPLRALTLAQSRRLVASLLPEGRLPASMQEAILAKAHGNPFFLEEVVRSLIDAGILYREGDAWQVRQEAGAPAVPESVQSVILRRVDRLEREPRRVLETAAVIGRLFRRRWLEQITPAETPLERVLWELEDRGLIYQERLVPEVEYSFQHVLVQEAISQSLSRRRRAALHQQAAEAIEALYPEELNAYYEQLAYYYERSPADEKAVEYLLKAGGKARRIYLSKETIGLFTRALDRMDRWASGAARPEWRLEALRGLGQAHLDVGEVSEAEARFRQAIALGKEMELAPRELVRLYWWLADVLYWGNRSDAVPQISEEGLALLGEDTESVEAALMNQIAGVEKAREANLRNAQFIERLDYSEELRPAYECIVAMYAYEGENVDEAMSWLQALEHKAEQHRDLRALGTVYYWRARLSSYSGDLYGAISHIQRGLELFTKIGDTKHETEGLNDLARAFLSLGDLQSATEYAGRGLQKAEAVGSKQYIGALSQAMGLVSVCQGRWDEAIGALQKAPALYHEIGDVWEAEAIYLLARAYLARGHRREAAQRFHEAIAMSPTSPLDLPAALSGLEDAWEDPEAFGAFCHRFRKEHPAVGHVSFVQWSLDSTEVGQPQRIAPTVHEAFVAPLPSDWVWHDPFGDCSFTLRDRLEIRAANGRDLWRINLSAPRLLRPASGEFVVQTVCLPAEHETPAIGGLLLWRDSQNYLRLDRGTRGRAEIAFSGCLENEDVLLGRGRLPAESVYLRLERVGGRVNALCSADGRRWFTVGQAAFPEGDPVEVGLHAIGNIDRTIYPGAYPEGTAIRFACFDLWETPYATSPRRRRSAR
jgi:adenylate cyclase